MKKKILKAIITGGKDQFGVWLEEIPAINGAGETLEEVKENLFEGLNLFLEYNDIIPEVLKGKYEIVFTFDASGFLKYYSKYISFQGFNKITGVNQKQLWDYANGYKKPSKSTSKKIIDSIKAFGEDMSHVSFCI